MMPALTIAAALLVVVWRMHRREKNRRAMREHGRRPSNAKWVG